MATPPVGTLPQSKTYSWIASGLYDHGVAGFADGTSNNIFGGVNLLGGLAGNTGPNFTFKVPEPTSLAILGLGLFGLGFNRRKRLQ